MSRDAISIHGARSHNLQGVDVIIPKEQLVVITGPSGSGKTSLAFDTLYAESQRRYLDLLSSYTKLFLDLMPKPDVDRIEGLSPAIAIEQKTTSRNPRSTVGTVTEIYDYLRLLFSGIGVPYSPATGLPIESQTIDQMVDAVLALPEGTRIYLLAPFVRGRTGDFSTELTALLAKEFQRVKIDGVYHEIESAPHLDKRNSHDIAVVVDRLVVANDIGGRLAASFETALKLADGIAIVELGDAKAEDRTTPALFFSENFACPVSGFTIEEIEPRIFSCNNPYGACPVCDGLGGQLKVDAFHVVPDGSLSIAQGAIAPWSKSKAPYYEQTLHAVLHHFGASMATPWDELDNTARDAVLYGTGSAPVDFVYDDGLRQYRTAKPFEGVVLNLERRHRETESAGMREEIEHYISDRPCQACKGYRLKPQTLAIKIWGLHIGQVAAMPVLQAAVWFDALPDLLTVSQKAIAERLLKEIRDRLIFLINVGLDYLTLSRPSGTLSGGEAQRIRLASQIGSGLTSVLYVLDEPSVGLHQRDNARLLDTLRRLSDLGNTVVVVEHDEDAIRAADYVIDIGPGAGTGGGRVIAQGTPQQIIDHPDSLTGQYLSGRLSVPIPENRRQPTPGRALVLKGATGNNLKDVSIEVPLGLFVSVTGVSGSGKSTLVIDTLYRTLARRLNGARTMPLPHRSLAGIELLDQLIQVDQSPIGLTPRSNPATYIGVFSNLRDWFAALPEAKTRGYDARRFSFNVKGGRCNKCEGDGLIKVEMHFLPDVYVTCDACNGTRFGCETLEIRFKGLSIADVLDMTIAESVDLFAAVPAIRDKLKLLQEVGLGYMKVGQPATTLSGGEAQRIKLAKELTRRSGGRTLYLFDEPTTGLHFNEVGKLLAVLHRLVDAGNTVVVIEHNLDLIRAADWVIDIGPEGGDGGGSVVASGTPEQVAAEPLSHTGAFLARSLQSKA